MIISKTPLRMSFAGGGSDLREYYKHGFGSVISTAIDKYIYITVNKKYTDKIRVGYSKTESVDKVEDIEHNIVRESLKLTGITKGVDIVYMSDLLPDSEGSGLGASSGLTVGTLHALHAYKGEHVSAETLAREACKIEIDILKHPIGKQDQYACAYGGFNNIIFNADETVFVKPVILKKEEREELNKRLLLFYTGINKRSDDILTEQKQNTQHNLETLSKMVGFCDKTEKALHNKEFTEFGNLLHEGWLHKKKLSSGITNPLLDSYYERARSAGAVGGKILGSGGGGFFLFYCEEENQKALRKELHELKEIPFKFEQEGSKIIYVND